MGQGSRKVQAKEGATVGSEARGYDQNQVGDGFFGLVIKRRFKPVRGLPW